MKRSTPIMKIFSPFAARIWAIAVIVSAHFAVADIEEISRYAPIVNNDALRGMSMITSAQSMGNGRMALSLSTQWYIQQKPYVNTPNMHAQIYTGIAALSYGLTHSITLFASQAGFASKDYTDVADTKGWGSFKTGVQVAVPLPDNWCLHLAGQAAVYGGTSKNQINNNSADGYNYFETRTKYDVSGKLLQTVCFGNADIGLKIHLNESSVWNIKSPENSLLVLAAGAQGNIGRLALGIECNSRTFLRDINMTSDPLWVTPTLYFRTPCQINISAGADISMSGDRPLISQPGRIFEDPVFQNSFYSPRALEPYRFFCINKLFN